MHQRLSSHKSKFGKQHKVLYYHFLKLHKESSFEVTITLLQRVEDLTQRLAYETDWINKLDTYIPSSFNTQTSLYTISSSCS